MRISTGIQAPLRNTGQGLDAKLHRIERAHFKLPENDKYYIVYRYSVVGVQPMAKTTSAALPIAYIALRVLIVLNWLYGAAILGLLAFTFYDEAWFMRAIDVPAGMPAEPIMTGLRAIAALGLLAVPLNHLILTRVLRMVATVSRGDPFIAANAYRLNAIAWALLALQLLSMVIGGIGTAIASKEFPLHLDAGFSVSGWLAVILTFVLARVFAEGTLMREDLEGTV
jgi:Protein of unknown function (DUF2975)